MEMKSSIDLDRFIVHDKNTHMGIMISVSGKVL